MIEVIEIENLRGIRKGRLEGLKPLTILTGPNASGKSTVLDALLIGASPNPREAVGRAVKRRPMVPGGAKWLLGSIDDRAELVLDSPTTQWMREMTWDERSGEVTARTGFGFPETRFLKLVDPGLPVRLHQTFTHIARTGRRDDLYALLSDLVPDFERLEILVEDDDSPSLYLTSAGRSVPVGLAGDGVQAFIQLALEVAVAPDGLVLVEEPEVYQHPKAIWQTAKVLLANMRRGVQMVITTHSLELIDAVLAEASAEDLENVALFNLKLEDGELGYGRRVGQEIAFARQTLENDLR